MKFIRLVDHFVRTPQPPYSDYIGTHYRLALRKLPYYRFVAPVFDLFYKTKYFPQEMWRKDDFALFEAGFHALL